MICLLLLYALTQIAFGRLSDQLPAPLTSIPTIEARCAELVRTRTLLNILWSCLSTIFLCTWGSLHPNISSTPEEPRTGRRDRLWRWLVDLLTYKLPQFFWALIVPEYILAWAIRQRMTADEIQNKVPGWTRTHGFFLIMGGFQLYERPDQELRREEGEVERYSINPGKFVRIREMDDVRNHRLETIIHGVTEGDLKDRGKSDWIAKSIVIIQTSWFVVQCMARLNKRLPLTELEIVTLAYTIMNTAIYYFWWDKPRDVGSPIRVYGNLTTNHTPDYQWGDGFVSRVITYIAGNQDTYVLLSKEHKVPVFWSSRYGFGNNTTLGNLHDTAIGATNLGPSIVGMAFGAVHFLAWWHDFLSKYEFRFWRMSCVALVAVPLLSTITCSLAATRLNSILLNVITIIAFVLLVLSAWLYIVARVTTIVIAFTALRHLPADDFLIVDWTTFIPHI